MPRLSLLSASLLASVALFCAGCELPHGPLRWEPLHWDFLPRGELLSHGPLCMTDDCEDRGTAECQGEPRPAEAYAPQGGAPRGPRLPHHHHAVPLAGPGVNAPWPKFHPVPTRPVFEPQCLIPVPELSQQDSGVMLLNNQSAPK